MDFFYMSNLFFIMLVVICFIYDGFLFFCNFILLEFLGWVRVYSLTSCESERLIWVCKVHPSLLSFFLLFFSLLFLVSLANICFHFLWDFLVVLKITYFAFIFSVIVKFSFFKRNFVF